jgi:hypothetical protein
MKAARLISALFLLAAPILLAQEPLTWTAQQDHQNMKDQLGIKTLRPAPSGSAAPGAPNAANYDPEKANPYPDLPDPLTLKNGRAVTTADMWWTQRRAEVASSAWSTKVRRAHRKTGARCVHGRGGRHAASTISRPIPRWISLTSASKVSRAMERLP